MNNTPVNNPVPGLLLVTGLIDLSKNPDYPKGRKSIDIYFDLALYLERLKIPCVFFIDRDCIERVKAFNYGPHMHFVPLLFNDLPTCYLVPKNGERMTNAHPHQCYSYSVMTNAKPFLVQKAAEMYPTFTHYSWIDAGGAYMKTVPNSVMYDDYKYLCSQNRPVMTCMKCPSYVDMPKIFTGDFGYIAAGTFLIPKDKVKWFVEEHTQTLALAKKNNRITNEEQIFAATLIRTLSEWYLIYSDYAVYGSFQYITHGNTYCPLLTLEYSFNTTNYAVSCDVIRRMLISIRNYKVSLNEGEMCRFLYIGLMAAIYGHEIELARELAVATLYLTQYNSIVNNCMEKLGPWRQHVKLVPGIQSISDAEMEGIVDNLAWRYL